MTAQRYLTDIHHLANQLPSHGYMINTASNRYEFAVGLGAAVLKGQPMIMPPNLSAALVQNILDSYEGVYQYGENPSSAHTIQHPQSYACKLSHFFAYSGANSNKAVPFCPVLIPSQQVVAIPFTSGTTGQPRAHPKTWGTLSRSVQAEFHAVRQALRHLSGGTKSNTEPLHFVATVPAQHMYGFESSVLIALQNAAVFSDAHPFFPQDVAHELSLLPSPRVLVSTPLHLKTMLESGVIFPQIDLILCATAPLSTELACAVEDALHTQVLEIYGCTEAGQIASRVTTQTPLWKTFDYFSLHQEPAPASSPSPPPAQWSVRDARTKVSTALMDQLRVDDPQHFEIVGRSSDWINIAGKRSALSHINREILSIAGVEDAVCIMPSELVEASRPIAFVVAPSLDANDIARALRGKLDAVFIPRPIHLLAEIPRNPMGKIQHTALMDIHQNDHKQAQQASGVGVGIKIPLSFDSSHPCFVGHFPAQAILPGAMLVEIALRALETHSTVFTYNTANSSEATDPVEPERLDWTIEQWKFVAVVRPQDKLEMDVDIAQDTRTPTLAHCKLKIYALPPATDLYASDPRAPRTFAPRTLIASAKIKVERKSSAAAQHGT